MECDQSGKAQGGERGHVVTQNAQLVTLFARVSFLLLWTSNKSAGIMSAMVSWHVRA